MKKTYIKPQIAFDNFLLSSNIASGCEAINKELSDGSCVGQIKDAPEIIIFSNKTQGCFYFPDVSGHICYHTSIDTNNVFTS